MKILEDILFSSTKEFKSVSFAALRLEERQIIIDRLDAIQSAVSILGEDGTRLTKIVKHVFLA